MELDVDLEFSPPAGALSSPGGTPMVTRWATNHNRTPGLASGPQSDDSATDGVVSATER